MRFCEGKYTYHGEQYEAAAAPEGAVYDKCRELIAEALKLNAPCKAKNCTFDGVWNGGGGAGQDNLYAYATSGFYYLAAHVVQLSTYYCYIKLFGFLQMALTELVASSL